MKQKFKIIMAALGLLVFCFSQPALANLEVRSENIIFYGDVKPEDAKRIVRNLEVYRSVILSLSGVKNRPDPVPLRIYAFKDGKRLNKFANRRGIAGLYTTGARGPIFLTVSQGGFKKNKWSSQVALHEYSHHVLHALSKDNYPRWYDEGFANYLSTFKIDGDVVTIGEPKVSHGLSMERAGWMDIDVILSSINRYPSTRRLDKFYGQSWLYVHYMQNTPELSKKLPEYLRLLKTEKNPLQAFEKAFGLSPETFRQQTYSYWQKNRFPVASFKAAPEILNHEIKTRELSDAEFDFAFLQARLNFLDKKDATKLTAKLETMEADLQQNQDLFLLISALAMRSDDYGKAKTYLSKAIRTKKITSELLNLRAELPYQKMWFEQFEDLSDEQPKIFETNAEVTKAVQYFEEALLLDEGNRATNLRLLSLLGRSEAAISEESLKAVERTADLFLKPENIGQYISVANVMARVGKTMVACDNFNYAKGRVDGYDDKDKNDDYARLKHFEENYPDLCV